jgi:hypothetical protein
MTRKLACIIATVAFAATGAPAQSPTPIIVQAIVPAASPAAAVSAQNPVTSTAGADAALKALQEMKAANDAILAKQAATLQQLDEMEKAADQIKIYTKRG